MKVLEDYVLFDKFDTLSDEFFGGCIHIIDGNGIYKAPSPNIAYHYVKAYVFGDDEVCSLIKELSIRHNNLTNIEINDRITHISRVIGEYDDNIWNKLKYEVMWDILLDSYKDKKHRTELLSFPGKHFIYCGTGEWTCGYDIEDAMNHQHSWSSNILGNMMTKIRDDLDGQKIPIGLYNSYIDVQKYVQKDVEMNQINLIF